MRKNEGCGSIYYWEGWDAASNKQNKNNPYPTVEGDPLDLEKNNDPNFMWDYGYEMYLATKMTFGV